MRIAASGAVTGTPIDTLTEAELDFLDRVADVDGAPEISGGLLAIARGEDESHDAQTASSVWRVYADDDSTDSPTLIGFGIRALQGERHAAEFLIDPDHRGHGFGETPLKTILTERPEAWCWSHGDSPPPAVSRRSTAWAATASSIRCAPTQASPSPTSPEATAPEGVSLRSFAPGDEAGWSRVNNAAFDWHPEQGGQTLDDIDAIVGADGFDPDSVILAVRDGETQRPNSDGESLQPNGDGEIIGFHETKLTDHGAGGRLGEVYVVGVDPAIHARGGPGAHTRGDAADGRGRGAGDRTLRRVRQCTGARLVRATGLPRRGGARVLRAGFPDPQHSGVIDVRRHRSRA